LSDLDSSKDKRDSAPLGLTVHSLPDPAQAVDQDAKRTRKGRVLMLLVMLACAAPVIASYLAFYVFQPQSTRSFGQLVQPLRALPSLTVQNAISNGPLALPELKGQWLLLSASPGACPARCENHLYLQRQLRESLGKDKDRLDWVWLVIDDAPLPAALIPAASQGTVLRMPEADVRSWLALKEGDDVTAHLYVVDPMGQYMMRFPALLSQADAKQARKDLERLLRASAFWDTPGR
jgi:hypothetical protein